MERTTDANEEISLDEAREAVRQVLAHLYDDERMHYACSKPGERAGHIYESLERLRRWLDPLAANQVDLEEVRRLRWECINRLPGSREVLEAKYGQVWNTLELERDFTVVGFQAPYVVVIRNSDRQRGSLEFQHQPRLYFNFQPD